jgi:hypothetical protein
MLSNCRRCVLNGAGFVLIAAFAACAPPTGTFFQREGKAFKGSLHAAAKSALPALADDEMAIGVIVDGRGKKDLTYVPFALHVPQGRKVSWVSWDGPFTLNLKRPPRRPDQRWPFQEPEGTLTSSGTPALQSVTVTVARDAPLETYNFRATLNVPGEDPIHDDYCPSIIIDAIVPDVSGLGGADAGVADAGAADTGPADAGTSDGGS